MYELRGSTVLMVLAVQGLQLCHDSKAASEFSQILQLCTMNPKHSYAHTNIDNVNSSDLIPDFHVLTGQVGCRFLSDARIAALAAVLHIPVQEVVLLH